MFRKVGVAIAWCSLLTMNVSAATPIMYGVTFSPARLYQINASTGFPTLLGPIPYNSLNSLAADADGRLYTAQSGTGRLLRIDPTGVNTTVVGTNADLNDVRAMAVSPGGDLYAITSPGGSTNPQYLLRLDPLTGSTLSTVSLGTHLYQGMDFSPMGALYAWDFETGLVSIDIGTGAATDQNPNEVGPLFQSITFRPDGALFGATQSALYSVFPAGTSAQIGSFGPGIDMRGIEYVPEPGAAALVAAALSIAAGRRRK